MPTLAQRSFAGGELGPPLYARTDTVKYATGARIVRNVIVAKHGGLFNRPGTEFICEVKDSSEQVVIRPFVFNADQSYVIEFGNEYIRFIRDGAQIAVANVQNWNIATVYSVGDLVLHGGNHYYCVAGHTGQQPPNSVYWYALESTIYEIPSTYALADLLTLDWVQSADVMTLAHQEYAPRELSRYDHTRWILEQMAFAPNIATPTAVTNSSVGATGDKWVVTAVDAESFEEGVASSVTEASAAASSGSPITVSWAAVAGAGEYNVYKLKNGIYGLIGTAGGTSFVDNGITPDTTDTPPAARNPFASVGNYPGAVGYYQQRLGFANTEEKPETAEFSRSANFPNFTKSSPIQDDDAVTFRLVGQQVNAIQYIVDLGQLLMLTYGGEWLIRGDGSGILRPGEVNPEQQSYEGASKLKPIIIGANAIYVQAQGSIVRDLRSGIDVEGNIKYQGNDLTIFAPHLFEGHTIVDWAFQKTPNSIIWAVRDDGVLLGLTYLPEHQIWGWHRHDFDGLVERVCCIPEGNETALYLVIKREIDGETKRYIERMSTRFIGDIVDSIFLDCAISYDGRNTDEGRVMTLNGVAWTADDYLSLGCDEAFFTAGDVGNEIHLTGDDGTVIRCRITAYTSAQVVTVKPNKTVPANMRAVSISDWARAVDQVSGADHLEGKAVSIFADGFVVASPNNPSCVERVVSGGVVSLDKCYAVIHVGLPITSDIELLDIDTVNGETLSDKKMLVNRVTAFVHDTRGLWVGGEEPDDDGIEGLYEIKARDMEGYDEPVDLATGKQDINIQSSWNSNGRVFLRQIDPVPMAVLAVMPAGFIPIKG